MILDNQLAHWAGHRALSSCSWEHCGDEVKDNILSVLLLCMAGMCSGIVLERSVGHTYPTGTGSQSDGRVVLNL